MLTTMLITAALASPPPADEPRPFYLIAHCANDARRVSRALEDGANGVELDVPLRDGRLWALHGGLEPRECGARTRPSRFPRLLSQIGSAMDDGRLAVLVVDAKETEGQGEAWGRALGAALVDAGIDDGHVIVSIPMSEHEPVRAGLQAAGVEPRIDLYLDDYGVTEPAPWLDALEVAGADVAGVGMDPIAFWRPMPWWSRWMSAMTRRRDAGTGPSFTYYWTINEPSSAKRVMDQGLDGLITNHPGRVRPLLDEPPYDAHYRLALASEELP